LEGLRTLYYSPAMKAAPITGVLLAAAFSIHPSLSFAQTGPFADLEGAWAGNGTISTTDGRTEQIRCRAKYFVSPSGANLDQKLRCASDSYHFDVNSGLVRQPDGQILGQWTETTRNATGSVSARRNGDVISAQITGPSFTAAMTVQTSGAGQKVEIVPNGSDIKAVSVDLRRE
jgi:hypothetical protein